MGNLMKFHSKDLPELMDRINRYSIGMDDYFDLSRNAARDAN